MTSEIGVSPRADQLSERVGFMTWTTFSDLVIAQIPAKNLRAQVRRRGFVTASDEDKTMILRAHVARWPKDPDSARL